ncbi:SCO family protein [Microbulbifer celer]|uniref:SCO family protein n=1 Tax=Microbulbifer celer TaxID=435905 RepID=A0ABW3U8F0_9GAMM|nr:hypothetical protein [Microbulbifer celer]UFN56948.1 hypothetical protein LPW13_15480 [Microbulbifer celer]
MTDQLITDTDEPGSSQPQRRGLGRWAGIGVFVAVALPIVSAYIVFYTGLGMPADTVNQGELLQPARSVDAFSVFGKNGEAISLTGEDSKWRYLVMGDAACSDVCEELLYTTRQVHIRLGEKARRVERVLVTSAPLSTSRQQALQKQHPKMRFASADSQQVSQWLSDTSHANLEMPGVLLVDQRGYAMMVYDNEHSGNQLLKDIKRLLKYSYEQ